MILLFPDMAEYRSSISMAEDYTILNGKIQIMEEDAAFAPNAPLAPAG